MNPFSLTFGKEPANAISRDKQMDEIVEGFTSDNPEFHVCMITGVRGSGKTVMMTEVSAEIRRNSDWIVAELSPERDMLRALTAELSNRKELLQVFRDAKINLSFLGFGLEIDSEPPITDVVVALDRMLGRLTDKGKKVLVTVDEAVSNVHMREFASQFQIFMRKNHHVFLLMTGLFENVRDLQDEKSLTFLYRAPRFEMGPLNDLLVAKQYKSVFGITDGEAEEMARLVRGYPYAYQVLGYLCYKRQLPYSDLIDEFDAYLAEYVYEKIWSELSGKDRIAICAMATAEDGKVASIRDVASMSSSEFSVYRDRLLKMGLVASGRYGYLGLTLPRFGEFALRRLSGVQ